MTFPHRHQLDLDTFAACCQQGVDLARFPHAERAEQGILVYAGELFAEHSPVERSALLAELNLALSDGPGVLVIQGAFADTGIIDAHSATLQELMAREAKTRIAGDHFAAAGANTRLWNAVQKAALADPDSFMAYYSNPAMHAVSEAWLGPGYQITAQVNVVHPGGAGQQPHRDYHLGFMTDEQAERYPLPVHRLSSLLTLQGAVAHSDMSVASGPTRLLPFSHQYELGYLAWRDSAFKAFFEDQAVQLPLQKGDQVWFNPALFHAAGTNRTRDVQRMANLLQVSSAFGRAMETVDRSAISRAVFPRLRDAHASGELSKQAVLRVVATAAEGYPFPTSLDTDPPVDGLAPASEQDVLLQAVLEGWSTEQCDRALTERLSARAGPGED
ncbi:phytanoyl-CoA dioxygenase [Natronospirillum operosum]|uniref:Phytanoyl-CoA dioxygenase n=1 Tax=Natronospirillum operosum TaxID=2759953 RepID=A0A4Z0W9A8_9GAMM|nr:phytanoyl-CoA dioxygenase family protein [Natronospirillum operosum]TGG95199.1 phytanoyl-CoA dioxygenase [Natronospirillum operosum]